MASDTYDIDILSRSGMIWIIDPCYKLVLMGIMWYICGGSGLVTTPGYPVCVKGIIMKSQGGQLLLVFLSIIFATTVLAYKPGPDIIRECPKCKFFLKQHTMMSGNTFGARFWTDGKMIAQHNPDRPWLVKCPKCGVIFWIDEAKKIGQQKPWDEEKKWPNAIEPGPPTESDYLKLLNSKNLPPKKEIYARRRAWWAANDEYRNDQSTKLIFSEAQKANLRAMVNLLDEKDPAQRITEAEILRELGMFEKCIKLLSKPFSNESHSKVAAFIKKLAEKKSWKVSEIKLN